jgi:aspartyl-tRNA(Asn)/glutamyl-tRNA(Gln) amidotransferase subunit A
MAVELVDPPLSWPVDAYNTLGWAEQAFALRSIVDVHGSKMDSGLVKVVEMGRRINVDEYLAASRKRAELAYAMRSFHEEYDILVTPSVPVTAFSALSIAPDSNDVLRMNDWLPYSSIVNMTGQPAISVPGGFDDRGMPFGIQFVAAAGNDSLVLDVAEAFELGRSESFSIAPVVAGGQIHTH